MLHYLELGYGPLTVHISEGSWVWLLEYAWKKLIGCPVITSTLSAPTFTCKPSGRNDGDVFQKKKKKNRVLLWLAYNLKKRPHTDHWGQSEREIIDLRHFKTFIVEAKRGMTESRDALWSKENSSSVASAEDGTRYGCMGRRLWGHQAWKTEGPDSQIHSDLLLH